jgi:hypothetical protein
MEKGLVVKKEIFIQKLKEDIRQYYELDPKVRIEGLRKSEREAMAKSISVDPRTNLTLFGLSKWSRKICTMHTT